MRTGEGPTGISPSRAHVVVWGRQPPPLGGVTRSVQGMTRDLVARGCDVVVVDPWQLNVRHLAKVLLRSRGVSIYHASGPSSLMKFLPFILADRRRKAVLLHAAEGGTTRSVEFPRGFRVAASRFSRIWVTNELLASHVRRATGTSVRVASPFTATPAEGDPRTRAVERADRDVVRILTFSHNGLGLYNAILAVESVELLRQRGVAAELTVVTYGARPHAGEWSRLQTTARDRPWLTLIANVRDEPADRYLRETDVLLRLTTTDGDSMVLREALALGRRVVASAEVPRPRGVEIVDLEAAAVSDGIMSGGRMSSGEGLGEPIMDEFLPWLADDDDVSTGCG